MPKVLYGGVLFPFVNGSHYSFMPTFLDSPVVFVFPLESMATDMRVHPYINCMSESHFQNVLLPQSPGFLPIQTVCKRASGCNQLKVCVGARSALSQLVARTTSVDLCKYSVVRHFVSRSRLCLRRQTLSSGAGANSCLRAIFMRRQLSSGRGFKRPDGESNGPVWSCQGPFPSLLMRALLLTMDKGDNTVWPAVTGGHASVSDTILSRCRRRMHDTDSMVGGSVCSLTYNQGRRQGGLGVKPPPPPNFWVKKTKEGRSIQEHPSQTHPL